jgi:UDP-N-acetylglucosamine--N-acetylmuramyl-(pentapeptide) pyrophosphoryl-undecaprenol N-acetylglucosamine transferase
VWLAARRGIPTAIFDADSRPGLTTRWLSRVVREVYLGTPEALPRLPLRARGRAVVTGTPILPPDPHAGPRGRAKFAVDGSAPVVLVTGGSQGALALNEVVAEWISRLRPEGPTRPPQVIWATGPAMHDRFRPLHRPPAVHVVGFLDPISEAYAVADLVVCRAGMLTIAELCAWGLPSILVPLPTAAADHQTYNAEVMASAGAAVHLPQALLTPDRLASEVSRLLEESGRLADLGAQARRRGLPGAAELILRRLKRLTPPG